MSSYAYYRDVKEEGDERKGSLKTKIFNHFTRLDDSRARCNLCWE